MEWLVKFGVQGSEKSNEYVIKVPERLQSNVWWEAQVGGETKSFRWHQPTRTLFVRESSGVESCYTVNSYNSTQFPDDTEREVHIESRHLGTAKWSCSLGRYSRLPASARKSKGDKLAKVRSPITGKVLKVLSKSGDSVSPDSVLLIVEAMKMENKIHPGRSGILKSVDVQEGDSVTVGATLAELEALNP